MEAGAGEDGEAFARAFRAAARSARRARRALPGTILLATASFSFYLPCRNDSLNAYRCGIKEIRLINDAFAVSGIRTETRIVEIIYSNSLLKLYTPNQIPSSFFSLRGIELHAGIHFLLRTNVLNSFLHRTNPQSPASSSMHAVIIGGGIAGTTCAATLRALTSTPDLSITLIAPHRTLKASKTVSKLTRTAFDIAISETDAETWCKVQDITFLRSSATQLNPPYLHTSHCEKIKFDAVCIATGARPFVPGGVRGSLVEERVLTIRDVDSVERVREMVGKSRRVLVVGGGGIGMEIVYGITGCEVVWVVRGRHVGGPFFDGRGAERLSKMFGLEGKTWKGGGMEKGEGMEKVKVDMEKRTEFGGGVGPEWLAKRSEPILFDKKGGVQEKSSTQEGLLVGREGGDKGNVRVVVNCEVVRLRKDDMGNWGMQAELSDGSLVYCDVVLVAAGVVPNVEWLKGSGVEIDDSGEGDACGGVLISGESMKSSAEGVFAAGDCTTVREGTFGEHWFQIRLWTQAMTAGRACAESMAMWMRGEGAQVMGLEFEVFGHVTQFFGKKVVLLGLYNAQRVGEGFRMIEGGTEGEFVRVVLKGGRVVGALLVGEISRGEVFENLILDGIDVSNIVEQLVDPEFDIEDYFD